MNINEISRADAATRRGCCRPKARGGHCGHPGRAGRRVAPHAQARRSRRRRAQPEYCSISTRRSRDCQRAAGTPRRLAGLAQRPRGRHGHVGKSTVRVLKTMARAAREPAPGQVSRAGSCTTPAGTRDYKLYVPSSYSRQALPLVVMLHGCTQDPDDFAAGTGMNDAGRRAAAASWSIRRRRSRPTRIELLELVQGRTTSSAARASRRCIAGMTRAGDGATTRSTRPASMSPACRPAARWRRSWRAPYPGPVCRGRRAFRPAVRRGARPAVGACGDEERHGGQAARRRGAAACRSSCSMATATRRCIRAMATR